MLDRLLRIVFAIVVTWCVLVEIAEFVAGAQFGMELDGDWFLLLTGSSPSELAQFLTLYIRPLSIALLLLLSVSIILVWVVLFSSRRVFFSIAVLLLCLAMVRVSMLGSVRVWKPLYVAFDTMRSTRDYWRVGVAGRWTESRALQVRRAPECATNYVFVIGESLTTARLPFFGYGKNTAPRLSALGDRLAVWGPVRAPSPYTVTSLMRLLIKDGASAPVMFRLAGYRTCFAGAHERWERYCSIESAIFSSCERKVYLSDVVDKETRIYDEQLLPYVEEMIAADDGRPFALFVHIIGSHFEPETHVPPGFAEGDGLDGYDRSVRYTDYVLARLIDILPPRTELFFISDHGESVDLGRWRDIRSECLWSVPVFVYPSSASQPIASVDEFVSAWSERAKQMYGRE